MPAHGTHAVVIHQNKPDSDSQNMHAFGSECCLHLLLLTTLAFASLLRPYAQMVWYLLQPDVTAPPMMAKYNK